MSTAARRMSGYLFVAPYLALFPLFLLLPLFYGLSLSFQKYEMISREPPRFIGLDNYTEALHDAYFGKALWATTRFVVMAVPATGGLALLLAVGINTLPERRQNIYRLCIFLPTML